MCVCVFFLYSSRETFGRKREEKKKFQISFFHVHNISISEERAVLRCAV